MSDKVIIASFGKTRTARTATQYQYNHGQKLQFENVDLPANYEVHFSNSINGTAKTVIGDSTGVVIPYEYFVPGQTIYAWIYVTDEDSGITIRKVEIPIAMKAKPTDQPLEPEDESLVEQVLNRLNDTIDEIPEAIDAALEEAKESGEFDGPKGDPFTYDDFTPEQLEGLKGPKGDPFTYDDFTPEQLEGLKGPKGDPFTYDDFTPEQLEALTGPQGPEGSTIWTTNTPYSYSQETGRYYFAASTLRGPTGATQKAGDLVYLSDDTNQEYKVFYIVDFQYGGLQVGCRYLANMQGPPGEGATGAVRYDQVQTLTEGQKQQARSNIGAASIADIGVVFRLKGSVHTINDLPSTGNRVGDVYFVTYESVGYVWLERAVPGQGMQGYWEKLGESIDINNLPNTIYWYAGSVDAQDNFTPDSGLTAANIDMYIRVYKRIPGIILSTPNGDIWLTLKLHDRMSSYSFDATIGNRYYEVTLQKIINIHGEVTWRYGYYSKLLARNEDVGNLPQLQTTDKSSVVNAINELVNAGSSARNVAAFSFIVELENDEYNVIAAPNYSDVYAAFEEDKVVVAKVFYRNGTFWTNYSFIGRREEVQPGPLSSNILFSGEIDSGIIFSITSGSGGGQVSNWAAFVDEPIWDAIDEKGTYSKPNGGIPKSDLAADVQASLDKADAPTISDHYAGKNLYDYTKATLDRYLNTNGTIETYSGRLVTDYLPVTPGKIATLSYIAASTALVTRTGFSSVCCYNENKQVVTGGVYNQTTFTIPANTAYVRFTLAKATFNNANTMIELTEDGNPTAFAYYSGENEHLRNDVVVPEKPLGYMRSTGDLSDGQSLTLPYHNVKNGNVLSFGAKITAFSKLKIGKQTDTYIEITATNVSLTNDQTTLTQAHGLTIANDIHVCIENETSVNASLIRVESGGSVFEWPSAPRFLMDEGNPYAVSDGSTLTGCVFSWTSKNLNCPIWLFGDSYFSWYPERWPYYLAKDGFTKACMLNGYAGEAVKNGMPALQNLLKVRVPQIVVWCLGMNNADNASSVNREWYNAYTALIGLSEYYGFELVLATIPSTPTVGNEYKNAIVRASGYRYIDFAAAVNTDANGSWISGALSQDNVHPTAAGAKILYGRVLTDLPEITSWGARTYSKPNGGIPKSDLASDVQASLGKADTALQSVPSTYRTASAQDTIDAGKLSTTGNAYRALSIPMGQLDGTSTATVMTATVPGITELRDGICLWLTNGVITSASGFTLNINGLGAKPCYSSLAAATQSTTIFNKNYTLLLVYNSARVEGGCWDIVYGVDTNTTYVPYSLGFGYGTCTTAAATTAKVASISSSYKLVAGGIVAIKFDNDVPAGATLNINSKGAKAIYYRGAAITAGVIKAGDTATFIYSTYYHLISIDRQPAEPFVVTYTAASGTTATCDKAYAEIMAALQAKQEVLAFYVASNFVAAQLTTVAIDPNSDILFTNAQNGGVTTLRHKSDGTITVSSNDGYVFRDQGIAHAGEFLVVGNDGNVTTMTISTWQGGNY